MADLDPIALSRELASAAEDAQDWHARLREEPEFFDDPFQFHRGHLGKTHFDELWELPATDPLREPLLRWTYVLTEQRIHHWWLTHCSQLRYSTLYPLETPIRGKHTLHSVLTHVITPGAAREHYFRALEKHSKAASDALATFWSRKQEVRDRFGLDRVAPLVDPEPFVSELAEQALGGALLREFRRGSLLTWLAQGNASAAADFVPARLSESSIADWFRDERLLEDLPLGSWSLPAPLVPATFLRALEQLGQRFRIAAGPTNQPFVVARDPFGLEAQASGYLFTSLLLNPAFVARRLGLDRKHQADYLRAMASSVLLDWGRRALATSLRAVALSSSAQLRTEYQERVAEHFGAEPSPNLCGVLFRLRDDDAQRFLGAALGMQLAAQLVEEHDEDWFRNPRAIDQLRSLARLSPRLRIERAEAEQAIATLIARLTQLVQ